MSTRRSAHCVDAVCGDGEVQAPEACDDGNDDNRDDCTNACALPTCGDGFVWRGHEQCDPNDPSGFPCTTNCIVNPIALSAGRFHTCVRAETGVVKCFGANANGQLGLGDAENRGDEVGEMGVDLPPVNLASFAAGPISAGSDHTCAGLGGTLKCWGANAAGQLGQGDVEDRGDETGEMGNALSAIDLSGAIGGSISAGTGHTCAVLASGALKCWGENADGQLGLGDVLRRGDQPGEMGASLAAINLGLIGTLSPPSLVAADDGHTCVFLGDFARPEDGGDTGQLKCWGRNESGQLGLGDTEPRGGTPDTTPDTIPSPFVFSDNFFTLSLVVGDQFSCSLVRDFNELFLGTNSPGVQCWGLNDHGQLGRGNTTNAGGTEFMIGGRNVLANDPEVVLTAGSGHVCALRNEGTVQCWGDNSFGQLGYGDTENRGDEPGELTPIFVDLGTGRTAVAVDAGGFHTCALLDDHSVKCWGANSSGQLGYGDTENRGDEPGEMGDALPAVDLF